MSFNEWRHRHTNYDKRMSKALSIDQQHAIQREIAMQAMQRAVEQQDRTLAASVMQWARNKHLVTT